MSVKSSPLPQSQLGLEISVGSEECKAAWDSVVKELVSKSTINGFRKGKAPKQMVISQFGKDRLLACACEEVIEKSIKKAIEDAKLSVIGQAQISDDGGVETIIQMYKPDAPLTFNVTVDVWPEATFSAPYENLQVVAEEAKLDDSLIDAALEDLRKKEAFSVLAPSDSTAELGQLLVADLDGYYRNDDGSRGDKLPDIAVGTGIEIKMNEGQYMPGFVEGLIGASAGESRDVNVEFPAQNPRKELAGQKAIFTVTVHAIKNVVLPELNDEFALKVSEDLSIEALRETIRKRLSSEAESEQEKNINNAIDTKLAELVEVEIPETLIESQLQNKFANMLAAFKDKGMNDNQIKQMVTKENFELYKSRTTPTVEKNLKVNFAISKIAKENNISIEKQAIDDQMALVRAELRGSEEIEEDKVRDQIEAQLEREQVLLLLKKTANIDIVPKKEEETVAAEPQTAEAGAQ